MSVTFACNPHLEKPGLLPPKIDEPSINRRRPADIFLPTWKGSAAALDLAVTSPHRLDALPLACQAPGAAARAYEITKRGHLDTAAECNRQGFAFIPMIAETSGGWGPSGVCAIKALSRAAAHRSGAEPSAFLAARLQRLSNVIRRASARAILRRSPAAEPQDTGRQRAREVLASLEC